MAHRTFGATRLSAERELLTFDFGIYGEETFTIIPEPSLGDCFELYDAPPPTPQNELEAVRLCSKFIERMLAPDDVARYRAALLRIPSTEAHIIIDCAAWITEQVTGFPIKPPTNSSSGRPNTGMQSKRTSGGTPRSRR